RGEVIGSSPVGVRPCGIGGSTALSPSRQPRREGGRVEPSWLGARTQGGGDRAAFEQSVDAALIQGARVDGGGGAAGVEGVVDVGVGVGGGGDERLPEHAVSHQFLEEQGAQRLGGLPVGVEGLEDQAGGAARDAQVVADAEFAGDLLESGAQTFTRGFHAADGVGGGVGVGDGEVGGQRTGFGAVGGGQQEHAVGVGVQAAEFHVFPPAGEGGDREPVAHGLAPARQVGGDAVDLLRAAGRAAVAGDQLVERQQRAVPVAQGAHPGEIARWRFVQGGGGFHDDAGDVVPGEQGVEGGQVAVGEGDGGRG